MDKDFGGYVILGIVIAFQVWRAWFVDETKRPPRPPLLGAGQWKIFIVAGLALAALQALLFWSFGQDKKVVLAVSELYIIGVLVVMGSAFWQLNKKLKAWRKNTQPKKQETP